MLPSSDMRPEDGAKYLIEEEASKSSGGHVLLRMTLLEEKIFTGRLEPIATRSFDWFSIAVFLNPKVPVAADARRMSKVKANSVSE